MLQVIPVPPLSNHPGPPLLEQEPPAPWALGRAGASGTIGNLGRRWCRSIRTLLLGRAGALDAQLGNLGHQWSLGNHRQLRSPVVREPQAPSATKALGRAGASGTIGNLGPWSCGSLGHHRHLGAMMCGSLGHCRQPRPLVVREPRAPSAPWCLDALGRAGASATIGPWSCGSLGHHRHLGGSDVREPRWLGGAGASDTIGNLVLGCAGASGTHRHLGAWDRSAAPRRAPPSEPRWGASSPPWGSGRPATTHHGGESVAGGGGRGDNFPAGQARAYRNVANDSRTKFLISGKDLLGWLMHCYGLELGLPILPHHVRDTLCLPSRRPIGLLALLSPCLHSKLPVTPVPSPFDGNGLLGGAPCYLHRTVEPHSSSLNPFVLIEPKGCDRNPVLHT
ncbi:hypothetical protein GOBAR_AA33150 [Gossypium barbadense]|uniref:Uncharacterized protein n=1 Tax=Gossypium barbadense TaxID=3634 RepID=A0A2P5W8Z6_GOSBA|nr:hypothetical protein GOBAR_AA33150 [Gossypium barbadense]